MKVIINTVQSMQFAEASLALGRAFADDPVMAYIFPQRQGRAERIAGIMGMAINSYAQHGRVDSVNDFQAVSVWQHPEAPKPSIYALLLDALQGLVVLRSSFVRAVQVRQLMEAYHPAEPHWYLAILGTVPEWQGKSLGGRLLDSVLSHCDQQQMPAYLESSNPANVPFYQRYGFVIREELTIARDVIVHTMLRNPQ